MLPNEKVLPILEKLTYQETLELEKFFEFCVMKCKAGWLTDTYTLPHYECGCACHIDKELKEL